MIVQTSEKMDKKKVKFESKKLMAGMDVIIKMAEQGRKINKTLDLATGLAEMAKASSAWKSKIAGFEAIPTLLKNWQQQNHYEGTHISGMASIIKAFKNANRFESDLTGLGSIGEMLKGIQRAEIYNLRHLTGMTSLSKTMLVVEKYQIPKSTLDAIAGIGLQQQKLFSNYQSVIDAVHKSSVLPKINGLQWALKGLSGEMASMAARTKQWNLLDDFNEISEEAATISDRVLEQEYVSKEDISEIKAFISRIEIKIDKKDKDVFSVLFKLIAIIGFILALLSEARNWAHKPEAATKNDIEQLTKEIQHNAEIKLTDIKEYRIVKRPCKVLLKPKNKSYVLNQLSVGYHVIVLQDWHQWLFISYSNPTDGLTETGWVLKKYLCNTK